jgi:hypothetical protein
LRNVSAGTPISAATCAIGRPDSNTSLIPRSINSRGYFLGRDIHGESPDPRTDRPRNRTSVKQAWLNALEPRFGALLDDLEKAAGGGIDPLAILNRHWNERSAFVAGGLGALGVDKKGTRNGQG